MVDWMPFVFLVVILVLDLILVVASKAWLFNFVFGCFSFVIAAFSLGGGVFPFEPYSGLLLLFVAIVTAGSGIVQMGD